MPSDSALPESTGFEINISTPAKVILHGEHSVVYGRLAIAASLGIRTKIKLAEINIPDTIIINLPKVNFQQRFSLQTIKEHLFNPLLPMMTSLNEYNWESPDCLHQETLGDKIENFIKQFANDNLTAPQSTALKALLFLLAGILGSVNINLNSFLLEINSELNIGGGTGSSASYAVALSAILIQYVKKKTSTDNFSKLEYKHSFWAVDANKFSPKELEMICNWAFCSEKIVHGTPSGIDNTICTYGGFVEFRKGLPPTIVPIKFPFKMLLINSNVARETKKQILKVIKLHEVYPDLVNNILNAMEDVSFIALQNFTKLSQALAVIPPVDEQTIFNFYEELGRMSSINHNLLAALGVSHVKLDEIIQILSEHGLHGKLTGAGGGGYAICLIPPNIEMSTIENIIKILKERGFDAVVTTLGGPGVLIE